MNLSDSADSDAPEGYSHQELDYACILSYDDYGIVVRKMIDDFDYEYRDYSINEIYEFAQDPEHRCQQYVGWTTMCLEQGGLDWDEVQDWKLVDYSDPDINRNQGFSGCVFETSPGSAIIACRGSEGPDDNLFQDWIPAFLLPFSLMSKHQSCAEDYAQLLADSGFGERYQYIAVTGHSLGGNDAEQLTMAANRFGLKINQCVCFDSPGNSQAHIQKYQEEFDQVKDIVVHIDYSWGSCGGMRYAGTTTIYGSRKTKGTYGIAPDRDPSNTPEIAGNHSPAALVFDDNGMVVPRAFPEETNFDDQFYLHLLVWSWLPTISSVLNPLFLLDRLFTFYRNVYTPFTPEVFVGYLDRSSESSNNYNKAYSEMGTWLGNMLEQHFTRVGQSNIDYRNYVYRTASQPSIRGIMSSSGVFKSLPQPGTGGRRRDFSDSTRAEILSIIDNLITDAPMDASHYVEWDEFERECKRLVPEAFPYFQSMLNFHADFERELVASKAEINRVFDEAIAVDRAHAEKIGSINDQLRQIKAGLHEMTESLQSASSKIDSIG
ncbi:MAG: DUF2974 domain-containing protein [Coriobacteriales bacterium]|jgi:hypothetical protein|nr:DUF2974 domain-containing protein [Coriobacteriales bacterium]